MKKPVLIFDYDGTIHNTIQIYEQAFRSAHRLLVEEGVVKDEYISTKRIAGWLGLNAKDMWNDFQPDMEEKYKELSSQRVGEGMVSFVKDHKAVWYPGAAEVLDRLKEEGYPMVILSNCKVAYREAHWQEFQMERWFERFYDCQSFDFQPKTEIVKTVMKDYPGSYLVIGDRKNDLLCGKSIGAPFIGCLYGFCEEGELVEADLLIRDISELVDAVHKLEGCL
ncbi:MAG: HAD hydrolase-like protein [Dorea sp.]|nr:HAD hydrolase-like protein [Dorea sp.]